MKEINAKELAAWMAENKDFQLIDVRESDELDICRIDKAEHVALGTLGEHLDKIAKDKVVVFMCRSGKRSANALFYAQEHFPDADFYNLQGGILAYINDVDSSLTPY